MICKNLKFTGHAFQQMFHRRISRDDVRNIITYGEVIKEYPDDKPYPSRLMLGFSRNRILHVVLSSDDENETCHIITAYEPDPKIWTEDFRKKRR